ncbi:MAG: tol-pal system protein YbgF [Gammaproteobacteria bacterium]|nr:MAG: tol-pal system protein YbgF [Gammaproteobacteria bacterium]
MRNKHPLKNKVKVVTKSVAFATDFLPFAFAVLIGLFSNIVSAEIPAMTLAERVTYLELRAQSQNKLQADLSYQFNEIQRQIRELTGLIEEHDFKLKQIQDRQRDLYRDIEYRLSNLSTSGSVKLKPPKDNSVKPLADATNAKDTDISNSNHNSKSTPLARREFERAFALVRSKQYQASIVAFQAFLKNYPATSYSANARYWMGQVYLVQNSLDKSAEQFTLLTSEFPNSTKTANAMLKLGDIYIKQKKWTSAKAYYNRVADNYTGAKQQLAKNGLQKIREAGY